MSGVARFQGADGRRRLVDCLLRATVVGGDRALAERIADDGALRDLADGDVLIREGADDADLHIMLAGRLGIDVKGTRVAHRGPGDHVGEIAAADPAQRRSAQVTAMETGCAVTVTEPQLAAIADDFPDVWRRLLVEANSRIVQRGLLVRRANEVPEVFIISSSEAVHVAKAIGAALMKTGVLATVWTDGVFRASKYPLEVLADAVSASDFAIAIVHGDDVVRSRRRQSLAPRDNVTFELGLFMGQLGRDRTIVVEPAGHEVKLASDLRGLTTVTYAAGDPARIDMLVAPTVYEIQKHIAATGVRK